LDEIGDVFAKGHVQQPVSPKRPLKSGLDFFADGAAGPLGCYLQAIIEGVTNAESSAFA